MAGDENIAREAGEEVDVVAYMYVESVDTGWGLDDDCGGQLTM